MSAAGDPARTSDFARTTVHATCLVIGEAGILLRGPSGAGKSSLCLSLLDRAGREAGAASHARLVGDDRVVLSRRHGRLVARPHPALAGMIEIRGVGLCRLARHAPAAVLRLVVDLSPGGAPTRLPEPPDTATILGVALPCLSLAQDVPREYVILAALRGGSVASPPHPAAVLPGEPCGV